jgi:CRISPR-associated protein Csx10
MKSIIYRITLLESTLATMLDGDPNSAISFDFLPGSVLRGMVIMKYIRAKQGADPKWKFDAGDPEARRLFFDGNTRFLNGYILNEAGRRTLPTPQSWQRKKGQDSPLRDFAIVDLPEGDEFQWKGVKPSLSSCAHPEGEGDLENIPKVLLHGPEHNIAVHTARNRRFGRAMPNDKIKPGERKGAVYRYDSLADRQTFEAAIVCDKDSDTGSLLPLLKGEANLGGSRSGGYSRVKIEETIEEMGNWREVGGDLDNEADGKLIVTLLSDTLIRDSKGQLGVDLNEVAAAISARLGGLPLKLHKNKTFLRGREIGGFNRKWGLPLPQGLAVQMGSVLVFDKPNATLDQLKELEIQGIGERRTEGFGRLAVNWHTKEEWEVAPRLAKRESPVPVPINDPESKALALRIVNRMLRQRLDASLIQYANNLENRVKGPNKSQLSRFRKVIHDALLQPPVAGRQRLRQYVNKLGERQATRKLFNQELREWFESRINDDTKIWKEMGISDPNLPKVGVNVKADLNELAYEYNLRLLDAVLTRAAKKQKGDN